MLALDPFNPAPPQSLNYVPASATAQQNVSPTARTRCRVYTPTK